MYLDGVEEEGSMHGFPDDLHPSEGEGQVGQTAADPGARQRFLQEKTKILLLHIVIKERVHSFTEF